MHDYPIIIFAALLAYVFGLFSKLAERSPITGPMVYVAVGILAGPLGFGWLKVSVNTELVRVMAEITLVLILFIDASLIDLPALIRTRRLPLRLLLIGLPLTMGLGHSAGLAAVSRPVHLAAGPDRPDPFAHRCRPGPGGRQESDRAGTDPAGHQRGKRPE